MKRISTHLVALVSLIVTLAAAPGTTFAQSATPQTEQQVVIDKQFRAFRNGADGEAFSYASPNLQKMFQTRDNFISMVKRGYGPIYAAREWSFGEARTISGTIYQQVMVTGPDGSNYLALYQLQQMPDGSWRITSVQMKKSDGLST